MWYKGWIFEFFKVALYFLDTSESSELKYTMFYYLYLQVLSLWIFLIYWVPKKSGQSKEKLCLGTQICMATADRAVAVFVKDFVVL